MTSFAARLGLAALLVLAFACADGAAPSHLKIVGGTLSPARHFYAGIMLAGEDEALCGGVFIQKNIVLTTAHCVASQGRRLFVSEGLTVNSDHESAALAPVLAVVEHPDFDAETLEADVALLILGEVDDPRFQPEPIPVNRRDDLPEASASPLSVVGFGNASSFGNLYLDELREVTVPLVPLALCRQGIGERYQKVRESEICAGDFASGGIDSCEGDSGSPLLQTIDGQVTVVGLVSWGEGCALPHRPGVYVRASTYARWIWENERRLEFPVTTFAAREARFLTRARCYDDYSTLEARESDVGTLKIIDRYALTGPFQIGFGAWGERISPPCTAEGLGHALKAEIQHIGAGTEADRLELKVTDGEHVAWSAPARHELIVIGECKELGLYLSSTVTAGYGSLRIDGKIFGVKAKGVTPAGRVWPESRICDLPGMRFDARWDDEHAEILVTGDAVGGTIVLSAEAEMGENAKLMHLVVDLAADGAGSVTLSNGSEIDLHTWELECNFPLTLTHNGETVRPAVDEEGFFHTLVEGAEAGTILAGSQGRLVAQAVLPLPEAPECRLNGLGISLQVTGR